MPKLGGMGRPREFDLGTARSAIRDEFWQRGFAATSVDNLLAATGLGKGSFYAAFGDKRAAFLAVLRDYSGEQVEVMRVQCSASPRAIEALRAVVQPDLRPRGCFLLNCAFELAPQDAEVSALVHETSVAFQAVLADTIRQAVAEGDLPASTRPLELAAALLAVAQGLLSLSRAGLSKTVLESVSRSAARALLSPGDPPIRPATTIRRPRGVPTGEHKGRQGRRGRSAPR
jgi:TetR/AcrR family transcriptional repressor of nem operon